MPLFNIYYLFNIIIYYVLCVHCIVKVCLKYADDLVLVAEPEEKLQMLIER